VRFYHGAEADQVTSAHGADALTSDDAVVLSAGHTDESPETLGLLAHELTHVARQQATRFVPPLIPNQSASPDDEEALAQRVETEVTRAARILDTRGQHLHPLDDMSGEAALLPGELSTEFVTETATQSDLTGDDADSISRWGSLPAPWEPLPDWVHTSIAEPQAPVETFASESSIPTTEAVAPTAAPAVQRAPAERSLDTDEAPAAPDTPSTTDSEKEEDEEVDLDRLARQVYTILKQRLATERRRVG
jgi:hypothetical protein